MILKIEIITLSNFEGDVEGSWKIVGIPYLHLNKALYSFFNYTLLEIKFL